MPEMSRFDSMVLPLTTNVDEYDTQILCWPIHCAQQRKFRDRVIFTIAFAGLKSIERCCPVIGDTVLLGIACVFDSKIYGTVYVGKPGPAFVS